MSDDSVSRRNFLAGVATTGVAATLPSNDPVVVANHRIVENKPNGDPIKIVCAEKLTPEEIKLMKDPDLTKRVNVPRSTLPAITHVDYSARVQTVDEERHGRYYRLMKAFEKKTGCPVIVNTSFNVRGEPIVMTPEHAFNCFIHTDMDVLVMEDVVLLKTEQPKELQVDNTKYLSSFGLD